MPARAAHEKVQITIDGVKYNVPAGVFSLKEIIDQTGINSKTATLNVSSAAPSQASAINRNSSYNVIGGEVFTSVVGA